MGKKQGEWWCRSAQSFWQWRPASESDAPDTKRLRLKESSSSDRAPFPPIVVPDAHVGLFSGRVPKQNPDALSLSTRRGVNVLTPADAPSSAALQSLRGSTQYWQSVSPAPVDANTAFNRVLVESDASMTGVGGTVSQSDAGMPPAHLSQVEADLRHFAHDATLQHHDRDISFDGRCVPIHSAPTPGETRGQ